MAYKVLGQSDVPATTDTDVYTVPADKQVVVSTIVVCNRTAGAITYRLAVRPDGAVIADQHYLMYDVSIPGNSTDTFTIGLTADAADVLTVYASAIGLSVNIFGDEI